MQHPISGGTLRVMALFRNKQHDHDPVWHVQVIMLVAIALQFLLPDNFSFGGRWILPVAEALLVLALLVTTPREKLFRSFGRKTNVLLLIGVSALGNLYSLIEVARQLLAQGKIHNGRQLIIAGLNIYITNIVIFALLYWEMDGGGPGQRRALKAEEHDFLFPQYQVTGDRNWHPTFIDYLYVSNTNATAFSPTDTMPLSRRSKMLMLIQSLISLVVVGLVAARAVNILQ
jgi:uncharacterized membrane protein